MLTNPRLGQPVRIHYSAATRDRMPLHGAVGVVRVRGTGKPRNHGVEIAGVLYVIPCGNLYPA